MSREILLSGSGGQGMITAGIILARAAIRDGLNVVQTQSYGPEARGGASRAEVILDTDTIDYPKVVRADVVLAMTQEACDKYAAKLKPGGTLIVDPTHVGTVPAVPGHVVRVPITRLAKAAVGRSIVANIVALGAMNRAAQLVSPGALEAAVLESVPPGTGEMNMKALAAGVAAQPE